jgi:hypothetical protein
MSSGHGSLNARILQFEETCVAEPNPKNPNDFFGKLELYLVRFAVFLIFLVGLYKVVYDTLEKILK